MQVSEELCEWLDDMAELSGVGNYDESGLWVWVDELRDRANAVE